MQLSEKAHQMTERLIALGVIKPNTVDGYFSAVTKVQEKLNDGD